MISEVGRMNCVNEERFIEWYRSTARSPALGPAALLSDAFSRYAESGRGEYVLRADQTASGREESYPFRCENIGACGASTIFMYF